MTTPSDDLSAQHLKVIEDAFRAFEEWQEKVQTYAPSPKSAVEHLSSAAAREAAKKLVGRYVDASESFFALVGVLAKRAAGTDGYRSEIFKRYEPTCVRAFTVLRAVLKGWSSKREIEFVALAQESETLHEMRTLGAQIVAHPDHNDQGGPAKTVLDSVKKFVKAVLGPDEDDEGPGRDRPLGRTLPDGHLYVGPLKKIVDVLFHALNEILQICGLR